MGLGALGSGEELGSTSLSAIPTPFSSTLCFQACTSETPVSGLS